MNNGITAKMQKHLDNLTKPKGSLGRLEELALRMAEVQNNVPPRIGKKAVYVFAGDHGVVEEGVSLYPKDVTRQMVLNFLGGGAAINALARGWPCPKRNSVRPSSGAEISPPRPPTRGTILSRWGTWE